MPLSQRAANDILIWRLAPGTSAPARPTTLWAALFTSFTTFTPSTLGTEMVSAGGRTYSRINVTDQVSISNGVLTNSVAWSWANLPAAEAGGTNRPVLYVAIFRNLSSGGTINDVEHFTEFNDAITVVAGGTVTIPVGQYQIDGTA